MLVILIVVLVQKEGLLIIYSAVCSCLNHVKFEPAMS